MPNHQNNEPNIPSRRKARFWLFFPFAALLLAAAVYYSIWLYLADSVEKELQSAGLNYESATRGGFPSRIGLIFQSPQYADTHIQWASDLLQIDLMPYNQQKAVARLDGTHDIKLKNGRLAISHEGNVASARADLNGLSKLDLVLTRPVFGGKLGRVNINAATIGSEIHILRAGEAADHAKLSITNKGLRIGTKTSLDRADILARFPTTWLEQPTQWAQDLNNGTKIDIVEGVFALNELFFKVTGRLGADQNKALNGQLNLEINDLKEFVKLLGDLGVITKRESKDLQILSGVTRLFRSSSSKGQPMKIKLIFKNGKTYLEHIDIGAAPKLPI